MQRGWDKIIDIPFPNVSPYLDTNDKRFENLIISLKKEIFKHDNDTVNPNARIYVMLQGEFSLCYALLKNFFYEGYFISLVVPTTERVVTETVNPDGSITKTTAFKFVRWRLI